MAQRMDVQYIRCYTDGSAALKLESVVPQNHNQAKHSPNKVKCKKIHVDPVAILSIAIAVCMIVMMCAGFAELRQARQQVAFMQNYVDQLEAKNQVLSAQYHAGYDLEEVRRTALAMDMIPAEQAAHVVIEIPAEPEQVVQPSIWEQIGTFLTALFA